MDDLSNKAPAGLGDEQVDMPKISGRPSRLKRFIKPKAVIFLSIFLVFGTFGWFGFRVLSTWSSIHDQNSNPILPPAITRDIKQLRGEGDGRVNILLMGMGGAGHAGGTLADTIIIASIDPETGHTAMLSLPRDLWVPIAGSDNFAKINAVYAQGEKQRKGGGAELMKQTVANILNITIHYYVRVDFAGFKKIIDTVGGIDVNNEKALFDNSYPCDGLRGYCPFKLAAGPQHLNGEVALKYARCRKGTCGSDFGRAKRQQEVITATGNKVKSNETLLNPAKINKLLSDLGSSVRTDMGLWELEKFMDIGKKVDSSKIVSAVLSNEANNYLVSGYSPGGGYILKPKTGNFDAIREYAHSIFVDPFLKKENARIELLNGSITTGLAMQLSKTLKSYNYNIVKVDEADRKDYKESVLIDYSGGTKPYTIKYLEIRFGVKARVEKPKEGQETDITVIVGNNYR